MSTKVELEPMNADVGMLDESLTIPISAHPLIIGIGNPLRRDDGLGWSVAEQLLADGDLGTAVYTVYS